MVNSPLIRPYLLGGGGIGGGTLDSHDERILDGFCPDSTLINCLLVQSHGNTSKPQARSRLQRCHAEGVEKKTKVSSPTAFRRGKSCAM